MACDVQLYDLDKSTNTCIANVDICSTKDRFYDSTSKSCNAFLQCRDVIEKLDKEIN